jgi:hypothetical protein
MWDYCIAVPHNGAQHAQLCCCVLTARTTYYLLGDGALGWLSELEEGGYMVGRLRVTGAHLRQSAC